MIKIIAGLLLIFGIWGLYKEISYFYKWAKTGEYHEGYSVTQELEKQLVDNNIPKEYKNYLYIVGSSFSVFILLLAYVTTGFYVKHQGIFEITAVISLGYVTMTYFIEILGILKESSNLSGNKRLIWDLGSVFFEIIVFVLVPISVLSM
ncbi:hypothetical protein SAC12B_0015 [Lactobacillus phage SAC12B]|uniref:Uncharacterized protein n=1 Tax=Lactobacillus phage SAC12B TaxID=2510941 RepID=A0A4Y5FIA1_9CAUD|nr:hypothetical protein HWC10_gp015 [Lactobacillus phage SAC12B]QBJ03804.1 hypothetical protein SAC12B_0015 [Lactobacillus phage SAC12B]